MTATEVEVQVGTAPLVDVDVQIEPPTFTVISVLPTGPRGPAGADGVIGADGEGVPTGGADGQVLAKASATDFDTEWVDQTGGGGGAPTDATYLTTTAQAGLSAEVVVGATPGGELGGTWAAPTVDAVHSGSSHAATQAAAEATAAAALSGHVTDTVDAHDASAVSFVPAGTIAATNVQAALEEVAAEAGSGSLADAVILAPTTSARNVIEGTGDVTELTVKADTGQTEPTLVVTDENDVTVFEVDQLGVRTLFDDSAGHTITTDATGAIDSTGGAKFAADMSLAPGLVINSDGSADLLLTASAAWRVSGDDALTQFLLNTTASGAVVEIDPRTNKVALVINGFGGSADAIQYVGPPDFNGEFRVLANGGVVSGAKSAPADGSLTVGTFSFHLDDTAGTPVLHVKGKDSAGTVFTRTYEVAGNLAAHINDTTDAHDASAVSADSTTLVGTGTDVQAVLEELDNAIVADEAALAAHLADASDAHDASAISILDTANDFTATDVEGALAELQTADEADEAALAAHIADTSAAHAASAVSADSTTLVGTGTDVQAVLEELDNGIADHLADAADAHDASAVSFDPYGDNVATDVQGALESIEDRLGGTAFINDLDVAVEMSDHFLGGGLTDTLIGQHGWQLTNSGASSGVTANTTIADGTAGRIQVATGTDAAGYAEIQLRSGSTVSVFLHGAPPFIFEWKVRLATLPATAQDFTMHVGLYDKSTTADPTTGFGFAIKTFAADGTVHFWCDVADAGTRTLTDSTIAVATATDYKLRVICDGAGTAYFYINGTLVHTQTSSTNFPDTLVDSYAPTAKMRKTAGTTGRAVQIDYFGMRYEYT